MRKGFTREPKRDEPGVRVKNYITPGGLQRLKDEHRFLLFKERPAVTQVVAWAASNGDRSENADYQYGKRRLRQIDSRIRFLSKRIDAAEVVDPEAPRSELASSRVFFGATVRYANAAGTARVVSIVGTDEVDLDRGHISWVSPLARALMKSEAGDRVVLQAPGGTENLEVLDVCYERIAVEPFRVPPGSRVIGEEMRSLILLALALFVPSQGTPTTTRDLSRHFEGLNGTFVVLRGSTNEYIRHNPLRAAERFAPCSTFKIPHTAILLETGVVPDPAFTLKYSPALNQPNWARDFDLTSAFKASALWYYQIMAQRLGIERERQFVERFRYGNAVTSGGIDEIGNPFWVDGSLRISANEQVQYLQNFYEGKLGLSERTMKLTRDIMFVEQTQSWRLSAKTGACQPPGQDTSNWYVGYVEKGSEVYYFALQIGAKDYGRAYSERIPISRAILKELAILD